jgi:DNA processing protein
VSGAICRHDPGYPPALAQLPSAPAVLHTTCQPERLRELLAAPVVALLGERTHSGYAHEVTFALARDLASAGVTIISGLHQGIDGIAHHGALHTGGRTIAVTGGAPEIPHPRQLDDLHHCILLHGATISEFPPGFSPPRRWCFLAAQRIIAALASIVVVIEAGERSSTLLAAQVAADLGHDVAVVPGRVTDPGGLGTFGLLRDGAHPVGSAQDVLELIL